MISGFEMFRFEKIEKISKTDLQNPKTMIYYVSVARRKRRSSGADVKREKLSLRHWVLEMSGLKKSKKIQKTICKVKKA